MIAKTIFSFFPCGVVIILSSITSYCFLKKLIFWCSIEIIRYSRLKYEVFVFPGSRPQFAFDGPDSNLYIEAPALNLYLPASPLNLYLPAPSQQFVFTGPG